MGSASAGPSIVKSVRQRQLLNAWLRLFTKSGALPHIAAYEIDRFEEEKQDMVFCTVTYDAGQPRYIVTYDGQRLVEAFGEAAAGRRLEDVLGPERAAATLPIYDECVARRRPSYSVRRLIDVSGREVDYERLLLPFGSGEKADTIIGSLKTISAEGGFQQKNLMRTESAPVQHMIHAIIDPDAQRGASNPPAASADMIEI
jgi:hypothetical protein